MAIDRKVLARNTLLIFLALFFLLGSQLRFKHVKVRSHPDNQAFEYWQVLLPGQEGKPPAPPVDRQRVLYFSYEGQEFTWYGMKQSPVQGTLFGISVKRGDGSE